MIWLWLILIGAAVVGLFIFYDWFKKRIAEKKLNKADANEEELSQEEKPADKELSIFDRIKNLFKKKEKEPERPVVRKRDIEVDGVDFENVPDYEKFNTAEIIKTEEEIFEKAAIVEEEKKAPEDFETSYVYRDKTDIKKSYKKIYNDQVYEITENAYEIENDFTGKKNTFTEDFKNLSPEMKVFIIDNLKRKSDNN